MTMNDHRPIVTSMVNSTSTTEVRGRLERRIRSIDRLRHQAAVAQNHVALMLSTTSTGVGGRAWGGISSSSPRFLPLNHAPVGGDLVAVDDGGDVPCILTAPRRSFRRRDLR